MANLNHKLIDGANLTVVDPNDQDFASMLMNILKRVESFRGEQFVACITTLLGEVIKADYTFVGRFDDGLAEVRTLCLCEKTRVIPNFRYALSNTPCQNVASNNACFHPQNVCQIFPEDQLLKDNQIEGYLGAPLCGPDGKVIGLLVALFKLPIVDPTLAQTLFSVFAGRIAAEITSYEAQQSLEAELQKSRKLKEQYQLLASQEREARHRAQKANRVKSAFVANMSHEVKTPMNAMLAFCQMLLKSQLNQSQRLQVQSMLDAGQQLMTMLNDVLELSRIEDGVTELTENSVKSHLLLDNAVEQAASQLQQKPIQFIYSIKPSVPPKLLMPEYYVQKVVVNLLSNAIKFTHKGEIHLVVDYLPMGPDTGNLRIAVADTGVGIDEEFIGEIFEPFTQQNTSNTRSYGGAGLGLHLVHRLVQVMDGAVSVESIVGQGSVFTLTLPVTLVDTQAQRACSCESSLGIVTFHGENSVSRDSLTFLGVNVESFDHQIPFTLQLVKFPVSGLVLDISTSINPDINELTQWVNSAELAGIPITVVVAPSVATMQAYQEVLKRVTYIRSPVLMHEWVDVVEGVGGACMIDRRVNATGDRILLVEDNRLNQEIALCILEDAGYTVDIANNGQEAVDSVQLHPDSYQLVLMDVQMPVMDGLEATRIIREHLHSKVPIIAVTAGIAVQDRQQCDEAGMDDFIPKPIDEDFVLQKVRYYMSGAHQM